MKYLFLLIIIMPFFSLAQTDAEFFKINEKGEVYWQKIYENEGVSFDDIINTVKSNRVFSDINIYDDKITFLGNQIKTDPKALGFSRGSTSFYALGEINAYFTIDYKPGRYRITAVTITSKVPMLNIMSPSSSKYDQTPIENAVLSDGDFKKGFVKKESKIMSHAIDKEFKIVKITDDNW